MSLYNLTKASDEEYIVTDTKVSYSDVIAMAKALIASKMRSGEGFTNPDLAREYLVANYADKEREVFGLMLLDSQHRLISVQDMFYGTINSSPCYPREIVKAVLLANAAACICFHNHPSGCSEPSQADKRVTVRLKEALQTIDVPLLDHFVVGGVNVESFAERGWI